MNFININSKEYKDAQAQWMKQTEELEKTEWYWIFKRIRRMNETKQNLA
jgi:hypothetical protein